MVGDDLSRRYQQRQQRGFLCRNGSSSAAFSPHVHDGTAYGSPAGQTKAGHRSHNHHNPTEASNANDPVPIHDNSTVDDNHDDAAHTFHIHNDQAHDDYDQGMS